MSKASCFPPVLASSSTNQLTAEGVFLADKGGSRHSPTASSEPASLGEELADWSRDCRRQGSPAISFWAPFLTPLALRSFVLLSSRRWPWTLHRLGPTPSVLGSGVTLSAPRSGAQLLPSTSQGDLGK